jgi:putative transposase
VRRASLCGFDDYSRKSFEHRKRRVKRRILDLGGIFACGFYAYAVMSNHYHLVVHMSPATSNAWSAEEVARRWVKLYPTRGGETDQLKLQAILANEPLIALCRQRLTDLSWLMKAVSAPIAR